MNDDVKKFYTSNGRKVAGGFVPRPMPPREPYDFSRPSIFGPKKMYLEVGWKLVAVDKKHELIMLDGDAIATEEEATVLEWLLAGHHVGVATGSISGVVALRCRGGGEQILHNLQATHGRFGTLEGRGGGTFFFFQAPEEGIPSRNGVAPGVDFVGDDGYFVPTNKGFWHQIGKKPEVMPDWLLALVTGATPFAPVEVPSPSLRETAVLPQVSPPQRALQAGKEGQPQPMAEAALRYAEYGSLVFPLNTGGKTPRTKNGLKDATRDKATISKWWQRWKSANIGMRTGVESGIVVLDVDTKNGQPGLETLARLEEQHGHIETLRARTPTGGLHLFFRYPGQVVGNRAGFLPGLDIRGQDGYVVVAPSRVGGQSYRWENSLPAAEMPGWLLELATSKSKQSKGLANAPQTRLTFGDALRGVQAGNRNDTIFRFACKLRIEDFAYDEALVIVKTAANNCDPPLSEDEAQRCLESAWRYEPPEALSDLGNAERFVARCGDMVRFVHEKNRWLVWKEHSWQSNIRAVFRMAKGVIRSLRDEAKATTDPERKSLLLAHGRHSESDDGLRRMLALAGPELSVRVEDLDRRGLVAYTNGVFDQNTSTFRPGRREDLLTKHEPFLYDPARRESQPRIGSQVPARTNRSAAPTGPSWEARFDSWIAEKCELGQNFSTWAKDLREDFSTWSGENVSAKRFGELIRSKGFVAKKSSDYMYLGLRLRVSAG